MKAGYISTMKSWLLLLSATASLAACVTINIYFPAAAAEKAADKIIDEVWQIKDQATPAGEPSATQTPAETPAP
jgi:hypothetical protein